MTIQQLIKFVDANPLLQIVVFWWLLGSFVQYLVAAICSTLQMGVRFLEWRRRRLEEVVTREAGYEHWGRQ